MIDSFTIVHTVICYSKHLLTGKREKKINIHKILIMFANNIPTPLRATNTYILISVQFYTDIFTKFNFFLTIT